MNRGPKGAFAPQRGGKVRPHAEKAGHHVLGKALHRLAHEVRHEKPLKDWGKTDGGRKSER